MSEKMQEKEETKTSEISEVKTAKQSESDQIETVLPKKGKKSKKQIYKGQAHIQCTYNNTIVTLTDLNGGVLGWSSAGLLGFKGAKKSTPYAATQVVADVTEKVKKVQLKELQVFVKGVGGGRESSIRALANNGFELVSIKDITPIPHNGCRPRRPRRV